MKELKYLFLLLIITILSCSERKDYLGGDIRLWKNTEAWELAKCISKNDFGKAEKILSQEQIGIDYREPKYGETLLFWAVWNEDIDAVKFLISHGANPNAHDTYNGESPIAIASDYFIRSDILSYLLEHGGNPNDYVKENEALSYSPSVKTPLIRAAFTSLEKTKMLVKAGADVNFFVEPGYTPLVSAERKTTLEVVEFLLFECNVDYKNSYAVTIDTGDTLYLKDWIHKRIFVTPDDSIAAKRIMDYIDTHYSNHGDRFDSSDTKRQKQ